MFSRYLQQIRASGRWYFTTKQAMSDLGITSNRLKKVVYRMKKSGDIISPAKGLYIIIPPEYKPQGSLPAEELVPILVNYHGLKAVACS
jgi:predicted transcriptional regulator of viral defense system